MATTEIVISAVGLLVLILAVYLCVRFNRIIVILLGCLVILAEICFVGWLWIYCGAIGKVIVGFLLVSWGMQEISKRM